LFFGGKWFPTLEERNGPLDHYWENNQLIYYFDSMVSNCWCSYKITQNEINTPSNKIKIYPNPANEIIHIQNPESSIINYTLFNSIGKPIKTGTLDNSNTISAKNIPHGIYFIHISSHSFSHFQTIIIQ